MGFEETEVNFSSFCGGSKLDSWLCETEHPKIDKWS